MCGRFYLTATPAQIKKQFKLDKVAPLTPRYNIAPTQSTPIVVAEGNGRGLHISRWGLVPSWSHDLSHGARMINARAETVEEKASYRKAFQSRRCLVPASGFYEWQRQGTHKQPYKISLLRGTLMAFAGLWETWEPEDSDPVESFTIITTEASKLVSEVHDRMPVIIAPADYNLWLTASPATAKELLVPYTRGLTLTPVSARVNNVQNDDAGLIVTLSGG
jgi:putative SOS response-associated peptidase YedK